jgi:DNA-binding FrmR family transcriptional regulator
MSEEKEHQHPEAEREAMKIRLRKIQGQLKAMEGMLDRDEDCSAILTQVVSAKKALKSFAEKLIHSHLHHCIDEAQHSTGKKKLRELITVLERYVD